MIENLNSPGCRWVTDSCLRPQIEFKSCRVVRKGTVAELLRLHLLDKDHFQTLFCWRVMRTVYFLSFAAEFPTGWVPWILQPAMVLRESKAAVEGTS